MLQSKLSGAPAVYRGSPLARNAQRAIGEVLVRWAPEADELMPLPGPPAFYRCFGERVPTY